MRRSPGANDIFIEHSGRRVGYQLARDENDLPMLSATLVDQQAPQRVTEGFGYPALPANVNVTLDLNDFSGGCGVIQSPPGSQRSDSYSYTQGIDLSWPGRGYLSPERQVGDTLTGTEILKIRFTSLGTFAITDTNVYELVSGTWTSRVASVTPTDIQEFEGNIYVAMGTNAYRYSSDGVTFTTSTAAFNTFERFTVRSGQSGGAVLWGVDANGDLRLNQNPVNGGDAWSGTLVVGDTWETVTSLLAAEDFLYVFKEEGIYSYDGSIIEDVFPARTLADTDNGKHAFLWIDGMVYVNYGDRLYQFDPGTRSMRTIWPQPDRYGHPEINGTITAIGGDVDHLYVAIKNAAGNTYILKGDPRASNAFHTWVYLGANDCTALSVERAGSVDASNPVVAIAYGTSLDHYILPGPGLRPEDDSSYRYETTGTAVLTWLDGGAALYSKFMTAGRILAENTLQIGSIDKTILLEYGVDGSPVLTELAESITPGITIGVPDRSKRFTWIRGTLTINTTDSTSSPVLKGVVFDTTPNPPRRRAWDFIVDNGPEASHSVGTSRFTGYDPIDHLFAGTSAEILFYDRRARRFITKIDQLRQVRLTADHLKDRELYQVHLFEMGAQGYLSIWYGVGNKFLLPDLPDGAVGLNDEDPPPNSGTFYPVDTTDHAHWIVTPLTHSYIRFHDVTIPQGATITKAYVRLRLFAVVPSALDIDQYMEDADTGTAPLTDTAAEALTLTTATTRSQETLSSADAWWTWFQLADITSVVQEIVDRVGWEPGNAMTYVGRQREVTGDFWSKWFDTDIFSSSTQETFPELYVEWTV